MKTKIDVQEVYPQLTRVETTIGTNGYPKGIQYAYYCDSRKEMEEVIEDLHYNGYEVVELMLRKRNGQQLWNRSLQHHSSVILDRTRDTDWTICLDMDDKEEDIKSLIFDCLIGDDEDYIKDIGLEEANRRVNNFYDEIKYLKDYGGITVFYQPDSDNDVDYIITEDSTGYHDGDVTTYQMAFSVIEEDEE